MTTATSYSDRLQRFQSELGQSADLAFLPISADLQYLTGIPRDIPNFGRTIHPGEWLEGAWIAPGKAAVLALPRMTAEFGGVADLMRESSAIELRILGDFEDPAALVTDILRGFNLPAHPRVAVGELAGAQTTVHLQALLPNAVFSSATAICRHLRVMKTEDEIAVMRRAGEITEAVMGAVLPRLRHGMTELDIIAEVDFQLRKHGSLGPSFTTSLYNTGPNLPLTMNRLKTWQRELHPPCSVLFDFGAVLDGYCYDYGRTVSFGEPSAEFNIVHSLVMQAQAAGVAALRAGEATCAQVDAAARKVIADSGYGENFRHRLGHGIGLDVHEPPFLTASDATVVQEGMLFTVEPSILQEVGFSARVEDVVVARSGGGEKLTSGFQELYVVD
ncbi:MAG: Xaa-Pro peptidase family protein [bacterium]|nr:Xaa-Pro peptidase family protein [bacterium]